MPKNNPHRKGDRHTSEIEKDPRTADMRPPRQEPRDGKPYDDDLGDIKPGHQSGQTATNRSAQSKDTGDESDKF